MRIGIPKGDFAAAMSRVEAALASGGAATEAGVWRRYRAGGSGWRSLTTSVLLNGLDIVGGGRYLRRSEFSKVNAPEGNRFTERDYALVRFYPGLRKIPGLMEKLPTARLR